MSDWADEFRILSNKASGEPGRWDTSRTPYLREIMDCLSADDPTKVVVFQKPTQIGGTEAGNNWVGSIIHQGLGPTMIVFPTSNATKKASKTRIAPMIAETPALAARVREAKSRDSGNTTLLKEFDGGVLIFAGANSATDLKSSPVRNLFCDELEEWPADVDGQGDPEKLAEKRTEGFARRKVFKVSTPTIVGGRIDVTYRASDQRLYFLPCPDCGHEQALRWDQLRWETHKRWTRTDTETGELAETEADSPGAVEHDTREIVGVWYECEVCETRIHEHRKTELLAAGRWIAQNPGPDRAAGFKLNKLYAPIGLGASWRECVLERLEADADTTGAKLKTWWNTVLGEAYEEPGETIDAHWLERRVETWRAGEQVPAGALLLTAGCDVQGDRLEVRVWGYGERDESWLVDRHVIFGSPAVAETWAALEQLLDRAWAHALGGRARISCMAIDAGDGNTTHFVRAFARKWRPTGRVIAIKGQAVAGKPLLGRPTDQDVNWRGKVLKRGVQLWPVGSDTGKAAFYARLRIEEPGPGFVHLPSGLPADEFVQLTAERLQTRYIRGHPKREWHLDPGKRNEALDCRVMADAAAERAGVRRVPWAKLRDALTVRSPDLFAKENAYFDPTGCPQAEPENSATSAQESPGVEPAAPAATPRPRRVRPTGGWMNGWRA